MFDWITSFVERTGYFGIALMMFLENLFPPLPSELIMPAAGYGAARGQLSIIGVVVAGAAGSVAGALLWYWIARKLGSARIKRFAGRHGRWLTITPGEIERAEAWFRRHAGLSVFFARMLPALRSLISIPAGLFAMPVGRFLLASAAGTSLWTAAHAAAGYLLGKNYAAVSQYLNPVTNALLVLLGVIYLYRVVTWRADR